MENLTTQEAAAVGGIVGGMLAIYGIALLIYWIVIVIARWKLFTKAGEKGWKSIVPIYSDYTQWKIAWKKVNLFWVMLGLCVLGYILMMSGGMTYDQATMTTTAPTTITPMYIIGLILIIPAAILSLMASYRLFKSFGKGVGMFILGLFFPYIVLPILAFGKAKYSKPQD